VSSATQDICDAMQRVETTVGRHYPDALAAVKATLAITAAGCLVVHPRPLALMLIGHAGVGKTMILDFLTQHEVGDDSLHGYVRRSDEFNRPWLTSHQCRQFPGQTIVSNTIVLSLSGWTRTDCATGISILNGTVQDAYDNDRANHPWFQWLAELTPGELFDKKFRAKFGPILACTFFYKVDRPPMSGRDALRHLLEHHPKLAQAECRGAVRNLLVHLFAACPLGSIGNVSIALDRRREKRVREQARLLERSPRFAASVNLRLGDGLINFARGSALAHGRFEVDDFDVDQAAHVVRSSLNSDEAPAA
jgi:hypothetical protein